MLFNSLEFFVFLAVVYVAYRVLPFRWQNRMLLVAGYVFYGWWDVRFLFLIAFSTAIDFSIGSLMAHRYMPAQQRWTVSLFLIGAALFFLCPNWSALAVGTKSFEISALLTPRATGLQVLAGTTVFVLIANLLIDRMARHAKGASSKGTNFRFGPREPRIFGLLQILQFFHRQC